MKIQAPLVLARPLSILPHHDVPGVSWRLQRRTEEVQNLATLIPALEGGFSPPNSFKGSVIFLSLGVSLDLTPWNQHHSFLSVAVRMRTTPQAHMFEYLAPSWRNFLERLEGLALLEVCRWAEEAFEISRLIPFPIYLSLCLLFVDQDVFPRLFPSPLWILTR